MGGRPDDTICSAELIETGMVLIIECNGRAINSESFSFFYLDRRKERKIGS